MVLKTTNIDTIEVCGQASMALLQGFPEYLNDLATSFLNMNGIYALHPTTSLKLSTAISILTEVSKKFGDITLYEIGKVLPSCAILPKKIGDLKDAFLKIDEAFKLNHFNAEICQTTLLEYNFSNRNAQVQIINPYPYEFNRGIITGIARKFEPKNAQKLPEVHFIENGCSTLSEYEKKCKILVTW